MRSVDRRAQGYRRTRGDRLKPVTASVAAAAAAAATAAAAAEGRLHGRAVHGERGELPEHVVRFARRARDDLLLTADELVEVLLALHARVLVDWHEGSVLSRRWRPGRHRRSRAASSGSSRWDGSTATTCGGPRATRSCGAGCLSSSRRAATS